MSSYTAFLPPQRNFCPSFSKIWPSWSLKKRKACGFELLVKQIVSNLLSIRLSALPKAQPCIPMVVVVFGQAPVMSNAGGASCIQHHCMHPLIIEAIVSWLSNCNIALDYRGASSTPVLRLHAAVLQRELDSALVLEQEISDSSKKFLKFQGDKLKI